MRMPTPERLDNASQATTMAFALAQYKVALSHREYVRILGDLLLQCFWTIARADQVVQLGTSEDVDAVEKLRKLQFHSCKAHAGLTHYEHEVPISRLCVAQCKALKLQHAV